MLNPFHNPPHLYLDRTVYFITARTIKKIYYFNTSEKRQILKDKLFKVVSRSNFTLYAWVILENHYHILIKIKQGKDLSKIIQLLHGGSSFELNRLEGVGDRQIWYNYWDRCIRNDQDFGNYCDYIHYNPVKHALCQKPEDYRFSSYNDFVRKRYYEIGWGYIEPSDIKKLDYDRDME